jgi:eukaryotic-like serine/threonine-protein kinase
LVKGLPEVRAGDRLGRYEINAVIGRGAMGIVYSAHDPKIGRQVAIKTISLELEDDPKEQRQYRERFFSEAQAAGQLSHPGIVAIYDVGETDDKQFEIATSLHFEFGLKIAVPLLELRDLLAGFV